MSEAVLIQPKITGYRQLSAEEAALMNKIKALGAQLDDVFNEVKAHVKAQRDACRVVEMFVEVTDPDEDARLNAAEPERWAAMGRTDLQVGLMKLTRAVAQPGSF